MSKKKKIAQVIIGCFAVIGALTVIAIASSMLIFWSIGGGSSSYEYYKEYDNESENYP